MRWRFLRGLATALLLLPLFQAPLEAQKEKQSESLSDQASRINRPRLGDTVTDPGPIQVGRGFIVPASPVRVLLAGTEPCGLVVTGAASFVYLVEDRFSIPIAQRNLATTSSWEPKKVEQGLELSASFDGAVIWSWDLNKNLETTPSTESPDLPAWAVNLLDKTNSHQPHQELLAARRLGAKGAAHALLHSKGFELELDVDTLFSREESLQFLYKVTRSNSRRAAGSYYPFTLASQPIERQWWEHEIAPLVAIHRDLEIDNDSGTHVTITSTTRVQGSGSPINFWRASLADQRSRQMKEFPLTIKSVAVNGKAADYHFEDDVLFVALAPAISKGQTAEIRVIQEGEYAIRYGGHKYWTLGTWPWHPNPPANARLATANLRVRVPADLEIIASGKTLSKTTENGFTVLETQLDKPMEFPVVTAGKFHIFQEERLGIKASVATYFGKDKRGAKRLLNNFFAAAQCYQRLFDVPYPFEEVEVVELASWGYGQAPPGVIYITQEAVSSVLEGEDRYYSEGVNGRYFHEVAHGWWPHISKRDSLEENWTSESFAEYTSAVCLDFLANGNSRFKMKASLNRWRGEAKEIGKGGSVYLANHLSRFSEQDELAYQALLYAKGPLVLHALRQELKKQAGEENGEKQFWLALRSYLKSFSYTWGGTPYLIAVLDQITGKSWQPWFERYVYGTEMPPFSK